MGHRGDDYRPPLRIVAEQARGLTRITAHRDLAETEARQRGPDLLGAQAQRQPRHPDVRALRENRRNVDRAEILLILDRLRADLEEPGRRIDDAAIVVFAGRDSRRHEEGLHGRAGLEDVGCRAVAVDAGDELIAVVRVEGRLIHHRQHFAARDIEHDDRAAAGALIPDRRFQLAVGEVLDTQVDGKNEIATGARRTDALHILYHPAVAILDDAFRTVLAGKPMIERQLETFLPCVVDVREAENVPGHFASGIVPTIFARDVDARNRQCLDLIRFFRLPATRDV